ncbi:MAG: CPBP family intramembrane metalloprotease [Bacteroidetes bacterium]|nr:CPBP family intramembrane metalloprotease [Bacteroidota bacterium]MBS1973139.1 CPBP family intramembrane metalloprotease [Bacteroidota bacterium]
MDNPEEKKPLIKQGWLRALLFIIAYIILALLITVPAVLLFTSLKPGGEVSNLIQSVAGLAAKETIWIVALVEFTASVACVFVFVKFIDKKKLTDIGLSRFGQSGNILAGFFIASAIIGTGTLILYFTGHLEWDDFSFNLNQIIIQIGILSFIAISEELVFRGYILNSLMQSFNKWVALFISALLFTAFHISNPGISAISLSTLFLGGVLLGLNYVYTKNLWFSVMLHFGWNFFQGPVFGYKISGVDFSPLLLIQLKGDASITGGSFGFEGSFVATALLFITIAALYLYFEKKYQNKETGN